MGVPNIETNPQKFVVGYDSPDGADMGGSALSKDGFYGAVPLLQRIRTEVEGTLAGVTTRQLPGYRSRVLRSLRSSATGVL